ncbi:hypothetical protein BDN72DRAFT_900962 [Pluteus cervinus]|uniref:Uncharacterized protein n=1 Tax=Pluteus cervinus TaxID=181527 RepID=A0ACD3AHH2_9AGAR|nr:hypothetical protein BDN72DRAFT_900962 [Pluteus cervinus]
MQPYGLLGLLHYSAHHSSPDGDCKSHSSPEHLVPLPQIHQSSHPLLSTPLFLCLTWTTASISQVSILTMAKGRIIGETQLARTSRRGDDSRDLALWTTNSLFDNGEGPFHRLPPNQTFDIEFSSSTDAHVAFYRPIVVNSVFASCRPSCPTVCLVVSVGPSPGLTQLHRLHLWPSPALPLPPPPPSPIYLVHDIPSSALIVSFDPLFANSFSTFPAGICEAIIRKRRRSSVSSIASRFDSPGQSQIPEFARNSPPRDLKAEMLEALAKLDFPGNSGKFAASKVLAEAPNPWLSIGGLGLIGLPLGDMEGKTLVTSFGQELSPHYMRINNTWKVDFSAVSLKNPEWNKYLNSVVLKFVTDELGVDQASTLPRLELDKLLICEVGSNFISDIGPDAKAAGTYATIVISLPSSYTGGTICVSHGGQSKVLDVSSTPFSSGVSFWFTESQHTVEPVKSGYRLALT